MAGLIFRHSLKQLKIQVKVLVSSQCCVGHANPGPATNYMYSYCINRLGELTEWRTISGGGKGIPDVIAFVYKVIRIKSISINFSQVTCGPPMAMLLITLTLISGPKRRRHSKPLIKLFTREFSINSLCPQDCSYDTEPGLFVESFQVWLKSVNNNRHCTCVSARIYLTCNSLKTASVV
jgi:hypothetical protein